MAQESEINWLGTEYKYTIDINSPHFDMDEDEFTVEIRRGSKSRVFTKDELICDSEGQWYVCFDSAEFGPGQYIAIITAQVPDDDFDDGFRKEVYRLNLLYVKS